VPTTAQITHHLARICYLLQLEKAQHNPKTWILQNRWMGRHDLNQVLKARHSGPMSLEKAIEVAKEDALDRASVGEKHRLARLLEKQLIVDFKSSQMTGIDRSAIRRLAQSLLDAPGSKASRSTEWLTLLLYLADGEQSLVDAYFARLTRGRRPSSSHHLIGYLSKVFNWDIILTTNFDDLLESALRAQGLSPIVYEIAKDSVAPEPDLVRNSGQMSIVKLHGGTHNLRADFNLLDSLDDDAIRRYSAYLPSDALVLVLGYGAKEERVVSLLKSWCKASSSSQPGIVWIYRSSRPDELVASTDGRARFAPAQDPGSFLHELYQRLLFTHPLELSPTSRWRSHRAPRIQHGD